MGKGTLSSKQGIMLSREELRESSEKHNVQRLQLKYRGALYIGLSYMGKSMRESYSALTGKVLGHDSL
jgi:hypothetical protein